MLFDIYSGRLANYWLRGGMINRLTHAVINGLDTWWESIGARQVIHGLGDVNMITKIPLSKRLNACLNSRICFSDSRSIFSPSGKSSAFPFLKQKKVRSEWVKCYHHFFFVIKSKLTFRTQMRRRTFFDDEATPSVCRSFMLSSVTMKIVRFSEHNVSVRQLVHWSIILIRWLLPKSL